MRPADQALARLHQVVRILVVRVVAVGRIEQDRHRRAGLEHDRRLPRIAAALRGQRQPRAGAAFDADVAERLRDFGVALAVVAEQPAMVVHRVALSGDVDLAVGAKDEFLAGRLEDRTARVLGVDQEAAGRIVAGTRIAGQRRGRKAVPELEPQRLRGVHACFGVALQIRRAPGRLARLVGRVAHAHAFLFEFEHGEVARRCFGRRRVRRGGARRVQCQHEHGGLDRLHRCSP
jgi:hypothetical protein